MSAAEAENCLLSTGKSVWQEGREKCPAKQPGKAGAQLSPPRGTALHPRPAATGKQLGANSLNGRRVSALGHKMYEKCSPGYKREKRHTILPSAQ